MVSLGALVADAGGLALALIGPRLGAPALPVEAAGAVSAVDTLPVLRRSLSEATGDGARTDAVLVLANALAQGLARGMIGLALDAAYRVLAVDEGSIVDASRASRVMESSAPTAAVDSGADRTQAAPAGPRLRLSRPDPLASGPVERWSGTAGYLAAAGGIIGAAVGGSARTGAALGLAALPKASRLGRDAFGVSLTRVLMRRGAMVTHPDALRRLDRVGTVVLDVEALATGRHVVGQVVPLTGADPVEVTSTAYELFHPDEPSSPSARGAWQLGPVGDLQLTGPRRARERRALEVQGARHILGLARENRLLALVTVAPELHPSFESVVAACHRSGCRLVVATQPGQPMPASLAAMADAERAGGTELTSTVQSEQSDGVGVLVLSQRPAALAAADVAVGLRRPGATSRPHADILVGADLDAAVLLLDACASARTVSARSALLAQLSTGLGALAFTTRGSQPATPRSLLAVNLGALAAFVHGVWAAYELGRRPPDPPVSRTPWHLIPVPVVIDRLATTPDGLSTAQARRRSGGPGAAPAATGILTALVDELANPLTPILGAGAALSATIGSLLDAALVVGVTLAGALLGAVQRRNTDRALRTLLLESAVVAVVRRDGAEVRLPADEIVSGDVIVLNPGDVVPADARVVEAAHLEVDESSLTGEAFPLGKSPAAVVATSLAERSSMVHEGTTVVAGRALAVVVATGASTEAGRAMAATRTSRKAGGVEARLGELTRVTTPITIGSGAAVVAAGAIHGQSATKTIGSAVSLAVASVPEGLPFLVSAAQLAAARRLSRRGVLVRRPRTIEALGRVDVLCFDKTGTLTEGRMALTSVAAPDAHAVPLERLGPPLRAVLRSALRATPEPRGQRRLQATDLAVTVGADGAGVDRAGEADGWQRLVALPFEPSRRFHATLGRSGDTVLLEVKGAPEEILGRCDRVRSRRGSPTLDGTRLEKLQHQVGALAAEGHRVLAVAERTARAATVLREKDVDGLVLIGLLALTDPVRAAAGTSVDSLRQAGTQIVMITGDHPRTAGRVADELNLLDGRRVVTGAELDELDDEALDELLPSVAVVARGAPTHKVRVVQAFQRLGRSVAMTGDGANDAPAIRLADVGIALGERATPAARAAADLVVIDDRLETIIAALVEGRAMWASVRHALGILVGGNLGEVAFTVIGSLLAGTSPLTARQILLVNLLTDLAPGLAVAVRPPRHSSAEQLLSEGPERSLGHALTLDIASRAVTTAAGAGLATLLGRLTGLGASRQGSALAALIGTQLAESLLVAGPSRATVLASAASVAVLAAAVDIPPLAAFFGTTPVGPLGWGIAALAAIGVTVLPPAVPWLGRLLNPTASLQPPSPARSAGARPAVA
ncbi:MAG: cation-translocating P-type ATPase [Intrasporangium sp.]